MGLAATSDLSSSLPSVVFLAVANPEMKFGGESGLAKSLGQALESHLSEGSSSLEPLQGSFPSVISPQSAKAGGLPVAVSLPQQTLPVPDFSLQ